ncbi:hypothetical protein EI94DRAFT_1906863 [Lactarius quietus]|nr:hypothetical protein EI94DRAFT_1906863 [Lactarius quietus]
MSKQPFRRTPPRVLQTLPHNIPIGRKVYQHTPPLSSPDRPYRPDDTSTIHLPRSASSLDSPVSVVESDDSMEYGANERPTAFIVFGGTGANPGNRPQSGPLTRALIKAAEVISASIGTWRYYVLWRSPIGTSPQTETTQDFTLTRQEILVAAEAAQRNPNVLERVKARALIEALEKARYNLAMNAAVMDEIRADVIEEAKEQMKEEQGDALSEWRTVQWESLSEAERAAIRSKAEQDILKKSPPELNRRNKRYQQWQAELTQLRSKSGDRRNSRGPKPGFWRKPRPGLHICRHEPRVTPRRGHGRTQEQGRPRSESLGCKLPHPEAPLRGGGHEHSSH